MTVSSTVVMNDTFYNAYEKKTYTTSRSSTEIVGDTRSQLVRTVPHAKWRQPTHYTRVVDTGNVRCCRVTGHKSYTSSGEPATRIYRVDFTGKCSMGGRYYDVAPSFPGSLENQAIIKALTKVKSQKVNLAQAFGERRQTARLVTTSLLRLTKMVHNVKRLKLPRKEDFFDYWLELQYGWKPLLMDVHGAMALLHDREKEAERGKCCVKAYVKSTDTSYRTVSSGGEAAYCEFTVTKVLKTTHKGMIRLDFVQSDAPLVGTLADVGITNPLAVAWELLPWSFVADWFVPVGDYLSLLDATNGWDYKGGSFSRKTTLETSVVGGKVVISPGETDKGSYVNGEGFGRQVRFNRIPYDVCPFPSRPDTRFTKSSPQHVQNGIALFMSAIVGKSRVR